MRLVLLAWYLSNISVPWLLDILRLINHDIDGFWDLVHKLPNYACMQLPYISFSGVMSWWNACSKDMSIRREIYISPVKDEGNICLRMMVYEADRGKQKVWSAGLKKRSFVLLTIQSAHVKGGHVWLKFSQSKLKHVKVYTINLVYLLENIN